MRYSKINLDYKKLLGFRLITPPEDGDVKSASHFSKVGRKKMSENVCARIGSKAGGKVGSKKTVTNTVIGAKAGVKI